MPGQYRTDGKGSHPEPRDEVAATLHLLEVAEAVDAWRAGEVSTTAAAHLALRSAARAVRAVGDTP